MASGMPSARQTESPCPLAVSLSNHMDGSERPNVVVPAKLVLVETGSGRTREGEGSGGGASAHGQGERYLSALP